MKHTVKKIGKNEYEYRGYEIDKYPHLRGYWGHYKVGKQHFNLLKEAKAYIDSLELKKES